MRAGGLASGTIVDVTNFGGNNGGLFVSSGGVASGTTVSSGGLEVVFVSGVDSGGTLVDSGGTLVVSSGGTTIGTTVKHGGNENVLSGGTALVTTVLGNLFVASGGSASGTTTISSGGFETLVSGGIATNTIVDAGGTLQLGMVSGGTLQSAGGTAVNVSAFGGSVMVLSGGTATDPVISGGHIDYAAGSVVSGPIAFVGTGGTLELDATTLPDNVISGFAVGDGIDLGALDNNSITGASFNDNVLRSTTGGGETFTLDFDPSQTFTQQFNGFSDGKGGTSFSCSDGRRDGGTGRLRFQQLHRRLVWHLFQPDAGLGDGQPVLAPGTRSRAFRSM